MFGMSRSETRTTTLRPLWEVDVEEYVIDLAWSPNGRQLAFVTVEGRVFLVDDADSAGRLRPIGAHDGGATSVDWRFDGAEFATAGHDGQIKRWSSVDGRLLAAHFAGADWAAKVVYQPGRKQFASASGRKLCIWSESGEAAYESVEHESTIADIGWNPDGSGVAVAAYNGLTLHVPGRQSRPRKYSWKGSSLVLAWSPKSQYVATGEQDSTVHFWHMKSGHDAQMWGFPTKVLELAWHRGGLYLATGGGPTIVLWDCSGKGPEGRQPRMFEGHSGRLRQLSFQHHGDRLASADVEGGLLIWTPLQAVRPVARWDYGSEITRLAWSRDDRRLAVGRRCGAVGALDTGG